MRRAVSDWRPLHRDQTRPDETPSREIAYIAEGLDMQLARRFQGKAALVTGGGSGIGRATAIRLAKEGASIGIAGSNHEKCLKVLREIQSRGGRAIDIQCDVTSESDCARMVASMIEEFGRLDVLVSTNQAQCSSQSTYFS